MHRTLSLLYPNGVAEYWLTDRTLDVGDKLTRDGQTWIVTSVGNFNRDGTAMAVTLLPDEHSPPE